MVLCYHAVSPRWRADLSVTPQAFERQMTTLARAGWTSVSFSQAVTSPAPRTVAITFDDAFDSVRRHALPVLQRLGFTATMFVPTDYVTREVPLVWDGMEMWPDSADAAELEAMTWGQLRALEQAGWEIGSHTRTHPHLTTLSDTAVETELAGSASDCAEQLGHPVSALAYPYGDVDDRVRDLARAAGYSACAALEWPSPRSGPHRVPRTGIYHGDSQARFRIKVSGLSRSRLGSRLLASRR